MPSSLHEGAWKEALSRSRTLRLEAVSPAHDPAAHVAGVSPDGERIATGHFGMLCIRDRHLEPLQRFDKSPHYSRALFLADGSLVCGGQGVCVDAYYPESTQRRRWSWEQEGASRPGPMIVALAHAPDGTIAVASESGFVVWLDAETGRERRRVTLDRSGTAREAPISLDPETAHILTTWRDDLEREVRGDLRVRSLVDGKQRALLTGSPLPNHGFVGPGGTWGVTWGVYSGDRLARLWDLRTPVDLGPRPQALSGDPAPLVIDAALHPDGRHWILVVTRTILVYELASPEPIERIDLGGIPMPHDPAIFSADGRRLVLCIGEECAAIGVDFTAA